MNKWINYITTIALSLLVVGLVASSHKNKKQLVNCVEELCFTKGQVSHLMKIDSLALLQFEYEHIQVDTGLILIDSYGKMNSLSKLAKAGTLVFRFFTETCMSCYDQNIQLLKRIISQESLPLAIITNANSIIMLKKLEHLLQVPRGKVYMFKTPDEKLLEIDNYVKPYYFWIDSSGFTSSFFLVKQGNSGFTKSYLSIIANKQTKTDPN